MNRRRLVASMLAAVSVAAAGSLTPVFAQDCQVGQGLGSSLLIPYFEVDTSSPSGVTTLFSVNNESGTPALVRVVAWTDWGFPTLGFDVYLEARDLQSFNVRDLLAGLLPSTGGGADLSGFPFCGGGLSPTYTNPALNASQRATLAAYHRGLPNPSTGPTQGLCAGENHSDPIARGFITVDVVDECSGIRLDRIYTPADSDYPYFVNGGGSSGIAIVSNRLWGDYFIVNPGQDFAQGGEAVPLWADSGQFNSANELTFYGRFEGYTATDERVPLPDLWSTRFLEGGAFSGGTALIVWRDVGTSEADPINCVSRPSWWPLEESFLTARDEAGENPYFLSSTNVYYLATQRVEISDLAVPYDFGRLQLGLADGPGLTNPRQAWVATVMSAEGRYSVGMDATAVNERCGTAP
jgi:hypothetical protein